MRHNYWLVDWWDLRLLGLRLVRLLVFLACQLVNGLLENLVDLDKDILRYLLKVLNLLILGLHLFAQRFDRLPGYFVVRVVELKLLLVLVLAFNEVNVVLGKFLFKLSLFSAHDANLLL